MNIENNKTTKNPNVPNCYCGVNQAIDGDYDVCSKCIESYQKGETKTEVKVKVEKEINNVIVTDIFALSKSPAAYQLTIHVTNLIETYNKDVIKEFKEYLHNPETLLTDMSHVRVRAIINHYGIKTCQKWFTDIYGWDFKKEVA